MRHIGKLLLSSRTAARQRPVSAHLAVARALSTTAPVNGSTGAIKSTPSAAQFSSNAAAVSSLSDHIPTPFQEPEVEFNDDVFIGMSGGEIFHEILKEMGVKHVFGYPGGAILPVFDGIYASKDFELILPRHEQGAGHMAEGYARATGKPGVVLVTSGPGATNTITPLQDALMDGVPLIVFSGQVPTSALGSDAFQEADVMGISRPCTKWNAMVHDITELPRVIREAFHIATTGRPGPVLVDLPKDVTASVLRRACSSAPDLPVFRKRKLIQVQRAEEEHARAVLDAASRINKSKRPVIYAGHGAHHSAKILRSLAEKCQIPVTTTLHGMGAFDEMNPLSLHMLGMHGSGYANLAVQHADCIIALGSRFDDRVTGNLRTFALEAKAAGKEGRGGIIHMEILPKNINKVVKADVALLGDVLKSCEALLPHLETRTASQRAEWMETINGWKNKHPFSVDIPVDSNGDKVGILKPQAVIAELDRQLAHRKEDVLITTGVGQHQMWAAQHFRWRYPRTFLTSGGLGTMGFGLPAAIGVKVARPDKIVIDIDGDASFSMTGMEMATAAQYNIGVKVLLLNNDFQGMVKQWQDLFYDERYSGTPMVNPDWVKLAQAFHCTGLQVDNYQDLEQAIADFIACDGPVLLEAKVCKKEHVFPMVPAGKGLHEMVFSAATPNGN